MLDCHHYVYTIAGIELRIKWQGTISPPPKNPQYTDFVGNFTNKQSCRKIIDIELIADHPPPEIKKKVFSTGGPWTLYDAEDCYIARWGLPGEKTTWEWSVAANHDFQTIRIFYSSEFYNNDPGRLSPLTLVHYPVDQFLLMNFLADIQGTIIHSCGGNIQGKGIIFPGFSGAGKSTLSRLLQKISDNHLFTDDRMIIRQTDNEWFGYGTPWSGDAFIAENERVNLDAILFITQADHVAITPVSTDWAIKRLLQVCSVPWFNEKRMQQSLDLCEQLIAEVPMYECKFGKTPAAATEISENISQLITTCQ